MEATSTATVERIDGPNAGMGEAPTMLTAQDVARLLRCSVRTVYRLADSGGMPRPVKLGALVRWSRATIHQWVCAGCPLTRKGVRS